MAAAPDARLDARYQKFRMMGRLDQAFAEEQNVAPLPGSEQTA